MLSYAYSRRPIAGYRDHFLSCRSVTDRFYLSSELQRGPEDAVRGKFPVINDPEAVSFCSAGRYIVWVDRTLLGVPSSRIVGSSHDAGRTGEVDQTDRLGK